MKMKKTFEIEGMSCGHCVKAVQKSLSKLDLQKANVKIGSAEVEFDEKMIDENKIVEAIKESGYLVKN
jgi:copper chaperone